jgi:hypothetical protein
MGSGYYLMRKLTNLHPSSDVSIYSRKPRVANEAKVGLNINKKKTKIMRVNTARQEKIIIRRRNA